MSNLVSRLGLNGNPFEHYTAETEPNISQYAVRPPYLRSIVDRARSCASFLLFGDRGAGKSATRITVYNEIWRMHSKAETEQKLPLVANLTDYTLVHDKVKKDQVTDLDLVNLAAFSVVEQVLIWLSSLDDSDRKVYVEGLDKNEMALAVAFVQGFYLRVPEAERTVSTSEALRLLNGAWTTKSAVWIGQRWSVLAEIVASLVSAFSKQALDEGADLSVAAEKLLQSLKAESSSTPRAILSKLVDFVSIFSFSGVVILIDKVDETPSTSNSAESSAKLVYPLLSHIQLLEVPRFSWIMFLWGKVKDHFETDKFPVRLDKLAHANITWNDENLRDMVEQRIRFFSNGNLSFVDLFESDVDVESEFRSLASLAIHSPRELIKLVDTIFREHDAREGAPDRLDVESLMSGQDRFVVETIGANYDEKILQQVFRVGRVSFVNKDVQSTFKLGDQGARNRIKVWEDNGLVKQSGTTAPGELGGKPAYMYEVCDPRVQRIIERTLIETVGQAVAEGSENGSDLEEGSGGG